MYINNNNNFISLLSFNQYKLFQEGVMRSKFDINVFIICNIHVQHNGHEIVRIEIQFL